MILDVGCGEIPRGDVNIDLYPDKTIHRGIFSGYIDKKQIPNFIICDAQYLPFRDKSFKKSISYHVIEHIKSPLLMIKEMLRVTEREIIIVCPHRFGRFAKIKGGAHINFFSKSWFSKILGRMGLHYEITYSEWGYRFLPFLMLPQEIQVKIFFATYMMGL